MNTSLFSLIRTSTHTLLAAVLLLGAGGCGTDILTHSEAAQKEGLSYYAAGDYGSAAGSFKNSIRQDQTNYEAYYWLGVTYDREGLYDQSIASFQSSLDIMKVSLRGKEAHSFRLQVLDGLAAVVAKSDSRDSQINQIEARAQAHSSAEDFLLLAKIFRYRGDADSAKDYYNRAALLDPNSFELMKEEGLYLQKLGMVQQAEQPLRRAYALNQNDAQVNAALSQIGIVPGPSLKDQNDLAKPLLPQGPLPDSVTVQDTIKRDLGWGKQSSTPAAAPAPAPDAGASATVNPRD